MKVTSHEKYEMGRGLLASIFSLRNFLAFIFIVARSYLFIVFIVLVLVWRLTVFVVLKACLISNCCKLVTPFSFSIT